jgi:guanine nucleotide-exchange factor
LISPFRDASYTTQPLELLNSLGFQKSNNQQVLSREAESNSHGDSYNGTREVSISNNGEHSHPEANPQTSLENSEGILI